MKHLSFLFNHLKITCIGHCGFARKLDKEPHEDEPPLVAMVDSESFKLSNQCAHMNYERALIRRRAQLKVGRPWMPKMVE